MATERVERRLAAILAADVAGYSRLMGRDEEATLAELKDMRKSLFDPLVADHRGRIVKTTGDGALVEFASAVDAVRCAMEIQHAMAQRNGDIADGRRIELRIGINVGDIIIDEGDIYGDGVNIAARIETLAQPGGICLSDSAYQQIKGKLTLDVSDMGEQQLKNIAQPLRVHSVQLDNTTARPTLALPDKPSIAVLPFQNMSDDPQQDYFADGMVEDIITALSRFRSFFVIARNSSFTYKGRNVDLRQVGRELGVRYILEGSVRKGGNRLRITAQLIEAATGNHLWAEKYDGALEDVFELQDKVTEGVVGAIAPKLEQAEIDRASQKPTSVLGAYDLYLRGVAQFNLRTRESHEEALRLSYRAIEIDPNYAFAYAMVARCYVNKRVNNWMTDRAREVAEGLKCAVRGIELGPADAIPLAHGGWAIALLDNNLDAGAEYLERALALNPNLALAWIASGSIKLWVGEHGLAIEHFTRAMRLSPFDPQMFVILLGFSQAHFMSGRFDEAASWAEKSYRQNPNFGPAMRIMTASLASAGRDAEAKKALAIVRKADPTLCISNLMERSAPLQRPQDVALYKEGLRKAGLPE
ncbi:MAG: adenylate/guanylate cyclase domain-containing protein [Xanthobacteraceae bacterium]